MFIAAFSSKNPSPVGAAFVETFLQNTVKITKLTPTVRFPNCTGPISNIFLGHQDDICKEFDIVLWIMIYLQYHPLEGGCLLNSVKKFVRYKNYRSCCHES